MCCKLLSFIAPFLSVNLKSLTASGRSKAPIKSVQEVLALGCSMLLLWETGHLSDCMAGVEHGPGGAGGQEAAHQKGLQVWPGLPDPLFPRDHLSSACV